MDLPRTNNDLEHWFGSERFDPRQGALRRPDLIGNVARLQVPATFRHLEATRSLRIVQHCW
jgi:hypothetical protein